jgi:hypothetical protein
LIEESRDGGGSATVTSSETHDVSVVLEEVVGSDLGVLSVVRSSVHLAANFIGEDFGELSKKREMSVAACKSRRSSLTR